MILSDYTVLTWLPLSLSSAYMYYVAAKRPDIKDANPEASFGELGKLVGAAWKALSEEDKKEYNEKAAEDKARYKREMEDYTPPAKSKDSGGKKKKKKKEVAPPSSSSSDDDSDDSDKSDSDSDSSDSDSD